MSEQFTYDALFAGHVQPVVVGTETITGGNYARGTVLGIITADGKCTISNSTAENGSEEIYAVLADDTDASGGDKTATVYYTGEFNINKLTFGGSDTAATRKVEARKVGIFFKPAVPA